MDNKDKLNVLNKIADSLTIDELDDFVKLIWMHDKMNIEFIANYFIEKLRLKLIP